MCACEPGFTCPRCKADDLRDLRNEQEPDESEVDEARRNEDASNRGEKW